MTIAQNICHTVVALDFCSHFLPRIPITSVAGRIRRRTSSVMVGPSSEWTIDSLVLAISVCLQSDLHTAHMGHETNTRNVRYRTWDGRLHPMAADPGQIIHHPIKD